MPGPSAWFNPQNPQDPSVDFDTLLAMSKALQSKYGTAPAQPGTLSAALDTPSPTVADASRGPTPLPKFTPNNSGTTGSVWRDLPPADAARARQLAVDSRLSQVFSSGGGSGSAFRSRQNPAQAAMDAQVAADFVPRTKDAILSEQERRYARPVDPNIGANVIAQGQWVPEAQRKMFAGSGSDGRYTNPQGVRSTPAGLHPLDAQAAANRMAVARSTGMVNPTAPAIGQVGVGDNAQFFANKYNGVPLNAPIDRGAIDAARKTLDSLPTHESGAKMIGMGDDIQDGNLMTPEGKAAARTAALRKSGYFDQKVAADKAANAAGMWAAGGNTPNSVALTQTVATTRQAPTLTPEQIAAGEARRKEANDKIAAQWQNVRARNNALLPTDSKYMNARDVALAQVNQPLELRKIDNEFASKMLDRQDRQALQKQYDDRRDTIVKRIDDIRSDPKFLTNRDPAQELALAGLNKQLDDLHTQYAPRLGGTGPLSNAILGPSSASPATATDPKLIMGAQTNTRMRDALEKSGGDINKFGEYLGPDFVHANTDAVKKFAEEHFGSKALEDAQAAALNDRKWHNRKNTLTAAIFGTEAPRHWALPDWQRNPYSWWNGGAPR